MSPTVDGSALSLCRKSQTAPPIPTMDRAGAGADGCVQPQGMSREPAQGCLEGLWG